MPAVCRGDSVDSDLAHCSPMKRDDCSDDVFVDGTGISRQGDNNTSLNTLHLVEVHGTIYRKYNSICKW